MTFLKRATAKLFLGPKLDDLAHSSPITEQNCDAIPNFSFPFQHQAEPVAHAIVSPLEPDYIHRPVTVQGELLLPHPLQPLVDLANSAGAGGKDVAGVLTATYPDMFREDLGRKVCVRFPNGDGWFNVVGMRCAFGATVDGCGGDGDDEAWLAGHLTLAVALRMMRQHVGGVNSTRSAAQLMQRIMHQAHSEIMQLDVRGSTAVLLHMCFHIVDDRYIFVFAVTGDTEAFWYDSQRGEWRYLVEPVGPAAHLLRVNSSQVPGAVGKDAADDKGNLRRDTNLQYGVVACRAADMFLLASDGVWDTLDAVQNGTPRQFDLNYDNWAQLSQHDVRRIVPLVPIFKQRRLTELTRDVVHRGSQAVVEAVVEHAFQSTRGERELFDIIDVASKGKRSIYRDSIAAKGERHSLYGDAKEAAEARGELIFAKPDHVGVQAFRPAAIAAKT